MEQGPVIALLQHAARSACQRWRQGCEQPARSSSVKCGCLVLPWFRSLPCSPATTHLPKAADLISLRPKRCRCSLMPLMPSLPSGADEPTFLQARHSLQLPPAGPPEPPPVVVLMPDDEVRNGIGFYLFLSASYRACGVQACWAQLGAVSAAADCPTGCSVQVQVASAGCLCASFHQTC